MKLLKVIVISIIIAFEFVSITNQLSSSKYPSCDLVSKGTDVSTFGCTNSSAKNEPCQSLAARSTAQSNCIYANYYVYKTFPFGFKQQFGPHSNLVDPKPKQKNELATFALGFILAAMITTLLMYRKPLAKSRA